MNERLRKGLSVTFSYVRISILINNFNYGEFLACAIESALAQEHPDIEVIVVDDGSSDDSVQIARGFGARVKLLTQENGGQGSAYNSGFAQVTGQIVIFLDADDWLYPNAAAAVAAAWQPGTTKIQFRLALVNRTGQPTGRYIPRSMNADDALALVREFGAYGSPPGSGNAFETEFLRRILPLEESLWRTAADTVPILLAPMHGEIISLEQTLGAYRLHRREAGKDLLLGNAPEGLWHEYERIVLSKAFAETEMLKLSLQPRTPLRFAPWESRIVALCIRFGGPKPSDGTPPRPHLALDTIVSVWRWPPWSWKAKLVLSTWLVLLYLLPLSVARRLASQHRAAIGVRQNSPA